MWAAEKILKEGIANLIIIGDEETVRKGSKGRDISGATIVDPATYEKTEAYVEKFAELRAKKGMTKEKAREILLHNYPYFGVMMVKMGDADGMVSGACHSSADTLRPCLQILKTKPGTRLVSRILYRFCTGLRDGISRNLPVLRRRTEPEPQSRGAGSHRGVFRGILRAAGRGSGEDRHAFPFHQGKRQPSGCG